MKILITMPPLKGPGTPQLGQNRQFQWFEGCSAIYPVVPAYAATMLKRAGYDVYWFDAIAKMKSYDEFKSYFKNLSPDIIAFETKTPVVEQHWRIINDLKSINPKCKIVLFGDHVTALPKESFNHSKVDFVLAGGDYDFLLLNLCEHLSNKTKLKPGIYYRFGKRVISTGKFKLNHDLNSLPFIDRELTHWRDYAFNNGNYHSTPGTYTMAGRDCWWGKCKFCSWPTLYPCFRTRSPESLFNEVKYLVEELGVREVMDDTGTFPVGAWLKKFCALMIDSGLNRKVRIDCNMRFGTLKPNDYGLMRKAGFRFLLFGLESASQRTLNRLNKGIKVSDITAGCEWAKKAGLDPHITCMIGYPWESVTDTKSTIHLASMLFNHGWVDTLQATIVIPYPGTPLYSECKSNGWLLFDGPEQWHYYDMRRQVMKSDLSEEQIKIFTRDLYKLFFSPKYVLRKLISIRSLNDLKFISRGVKQVFKHLADFGGKQ
ncbi:MAG: radical SAM protein [Candidatus Nanoarchaeia archaeon]|jgi:radical SAM superfamily enzyme YgiQ (UPF0313 family)